MSDARIRFAAVVAEMLLLVAAVPMLAVAQPAEPQRPTQPPTFRTGVELVAVDVSVTDRDGRPVPDLRAEEFTVRVDGSTRRLVSAQFVPLGPSARARTTGVTATHYSTNAGAVGGRLIVFVVDKGNIRRGEGRPLMSAASEFIGRLDPADRLALAVIPEAGPYADFTTDHRSVQRQIATQVGSAGQPLSPFAVGLTEALAIARQDLRARDQIVGRECQVTAVTTAPEGRQGPARATLDAEAARVKQCEIEVMAEARLVYLNARQQTSSSMIALRNLLARLALVSGPKTLILLSEGLFVDYRETGEFHQVAAAAAAANATLYALGLDSQVTDASVERISPTFNNDRVLRREGLELLLGMCRGRVFNVVTGARAAFDRIARELAGYYLLSFEPEPADRDGERHEINVDVRRPGVEVMARRHFLVDRDLASRPVGDVLAEILRTPLPATDLLMRAATYVYPSEGRQVRLVIAADIEGATAAGAVPCGFSLLDASGKVVGAEVEGPSAAAQPRDGMHGYLAAFVLNPGQYTLKIAAVDDLGRRGSVEHRVEARLTTAGQLHVGTLMLADAPNGPRGAVRPSVDTRMTSDAVVAYVELGSEVPSLLDSARVQLEVAPAETAPAIQHADVRVESPSIRRRIVEGRLPTDLLPPGEYVARAVVSVGSAEVARATRPFRLERPLTSDRVPSAVVTPASARRLRGPSAIAGVAPFSREQVLASDVLTYFLDRLPAAPGATPASAVAMAVAAVRKGEFGGVESALETEGDDDVGAAFLRGLARLARGQLEPAAQQFRLALRLSPDYFPAAFYLGACYAAGGRDEEAAGAWQTSLITEAEAPFVYEVLGDALIRIEEGDQAIDILSEARTLWPSDDRFVRRLAVAQAVARQHDAALATLDRHLDAHPADRDAWLLGAWLLYDAHMAGKAIEPAGDARARFQRYRDRYAALGGKDVTLVEQWQRAMEREK